MANIRKKERNEELVRLRDADPKDWTFRRLALRYNIDGSNAYYIYKREKARPKRH